MTDDNQAHWDRVYRDKDATAVSWFSPHLAPSLTLLERAGLDAATRVIDIGGGASTLVDDLLDRGVSHVTVLDLSAESLLVARRRLAERASRVAWLAEDVTRAVFPLHAFDLWHDRAVLHFLTRPSDAEAYVRAASHAVKPGGHAVIGGFSRSGPTRCSGLEVVRRDAADLATLFDAAFELVGQLEDVHATPNGGTQHFAYAMLRRRFPD